MWWDYLFSLAIVSLASLGCAGSGGDTAALPPDAGPCAVTRVVDGDTVYVSCSEAGRWSADRVKVRLLNIDAPERGQPGYDEASVALGALVANREVYLAFAEPGQPSYGRYGRLLAYLFVDDLNVNVEMVRLGFSAFYTKYGDGRFAEQFRDAETQNL
ncbi:MAG: hypothetical protein HKP27_11495 [Myxococcales bacterium]|nr:hypothetical protein [Myxococcales bacterium]